MITVTEEAKVLLKNMELERPEGAVLRLAPVYAHPENGEAQIGLRFGESSGDDQVVEHEERELLRIAWPVSEALNGSTLHLVQTPEGRGLGIELPKTEPPVPDGS
jgi:iron-sulfur cluster assembly protein